MAAGFPGKPSCPSGRPDHPPPSINGKGNRRCFGGDKHRRHEAPTRRHVGADYEGPNSRQRAAGYCAPWRTVRGRTLASAAGCAPWRTMRGRTLAGAAGCATWGTMRCRFLASAAGCATWQTMRGRTLASAAGCAP
eukprot:793618-Prorocentrum_minimum.AAC.2